MRKPGFAICPEGACAIGFSVFSAIFFAILELWIPAFVFWIFAAFSLHFFRDPEREAPEEPNAAASPADGEIIAIKSLPDPFTGETVQCISIFMNVFSCHVNRAPVASQVCRIRYMPGAFINASFDKASEKNERCLWQLQDENKQYWTMVQIAGLIARRIVCRAEIGDLLARGERMGMIRFGSRVDLYLPQGYVPAVKLKDKVFAGESIIAKKQ